ncbi:MAG: SurA N-terminal domain-containing protein [Bdellovibrionota bacterium]|nr:SurA N-terminal domain-containing protein [Bdellovibrionota bacterium]
MSSNFQKTTSNFFVTFLIGLIVVSFMFTGYESMKGAPNAVAKVGSHPISAREYQNEYNRQLNFYKNAIFGGKDLSSSDIERFKIKQQTLTNLVQGKLQLIFADKTGTVAAPAQIKKMVKEFQFFQTNGQFDLNKYKGLLAANGWSPKEFEADMRNQVLRESTMKYFQNFPVSDRYMNEVGRFKEMRYDATVAEISQSSLRKFLPVSKTEIKEYLENEANLARTENRFKERKSTLDKPERVRASHILVKTEKEAKALEGKLTTRNFASMAKKHSVDTSNADKGGTLGTFGRGRMVPEFEKVAFSQKPGTISKAVKTQFGYHFIHVQKKIPAFSAEFKDFQNDLAKEMIQESKTEELKALHTKVTEEVAAAIKAYDEKKLQSLKEKYGFALDSNIQFNRFEGSLGDIQIPAEQNKEIFDGLKVQDPNMFTFNLSDKNLIVSIQKSFNKDLPVFDLEKEKNGLQMVLSNKIRTDVLKTIGDDTPVKQFVEL